MTNNDWDKHAQLYDETQGKTGDIAHQLLFDPIITEVLGDLSDKVVLDAGCGNGYWVRRLVKSAAKVVGIDESSQLIEIAKKKKNPDNAEFRVMDLLGDLDFVDATFDIILSSMVFHYLPSLDKPASEFQRILKPRGRVVICIQHPLYQYHFRALDKAGKKAETFPKTVGYFDRTAIKQVTLFGKAELTTYNRPLEDYFKAFFKESFVLTDFREPEYTEELLEKNPRYKEVREIPRALILEFKKP